MSLSKVGIERYRSHYVEGRIKFGLDTFSIAMAAVDDGTSSPTCLVLYTDASIRHPTPSRPGIFGYGIAWRAPLLPHLAPFGHPEEQEWNWHSTSRPILLTHNSTYAEATALALGLDKAEELYVGREPATIVLYTDNPDAIAKIRDPPRTPAGSITDATLYGTLAIRLARLADRGFMLEVNLVPGHATSLGNKLADYWAHHAAFEAFGVPLTPASYDYAGRMVARRAVNAREARRLELGNLAYDAEKEERKAAVERVAKRKRGEEEVVVVEGDKLKRKREEDEEEEHDERKRKREEPEPEPDVDDEWARFCAEMGGA